jgi:CHAP domain
MSIVDVMARIQAIETAFAPPQAAPAAQPSTATTTSFDSTLQGAMGTGVTFGAGGATGAAAPATATGTSAGQAIVNIARGEVGQAESPPGSNNSPRIAMYRQATAGSGVGPWCAYFASWAARQAGVPLGDHGQGFGAVSDVWSWAQRSGKALPAGSKPAPGDLIVWGSRHIGIVQSVDSNGTIHTIEGNSSDRVSQRTYGPDGGGATGYVHLG